MKALLCFHGFCCDKHNFDYIAKDIKLDYNLIYIPDLPGHGSNKFRFCKKNILSFVLSEYDKLKKSYEVIDVIGYSLGGVLASYLATYRKVNKLILISPAFIYTNISLNKIKYIKYSKKDFTLKKIYYFYEFCEITADIKRQIYKIFCPCLVIIGKKDQLISFKSGFFGYKLVQNELRSYIEYELLDHYNILQDRKVKEDIINFLNKKIN